MELIERVRRVISGSGSTNAEFAERIGIDPTKLSKSLNGTRRFTSFELAAIAAEARTTVDWLLTGEEPERALIAARHSAREIDDALQAAERRVRELAEVASALDKLVDRPALAVLPEAVSTGRPLDDAAATADDFLAILRKTDRSAAFRTDPATTVEGLFDIGVACEQFARGFDGLALNSSRYRFIIVNTNNAWSRQRFTLAHEIGHIVAGDGSHSGLCVDQDVMATGQTVQEKRANAFAACVLMPHDELNEAVDRGSRLDERGFGRLVGQFCVSPSALAWRLKNLGLVDDAERAHLGSMPMKKAAERGGWSARLAELTMDQNRTRRPSKLATRTVEAFVTGAVSARLVATALNTEPQAVLAAWDQVTEAAPTSTDSREVVFQP